jgi:alpha-L-fucosidase 2
MLLGSHGDEIRLLPALPDAWAEGSVSGLRARGDFEVDVEWSGGRLDGATVRSGSGATCRIRATPDLAVESADGGSVDVHRDDGVLVFETRAGESYRVTTVSSFS